MESSRETYHTLALPGDQGDVAKTAYLQAGDYSPAVFYKRKAVFYKRKAVFQLRGDRDAIYRKAPTTIES